MAGSIAAQPGFAQTIAGTGPVFAAFLIPHIMAGLTALSSGAAVLVSRKGTRWHMRAGATYCWAIALLVVTAAGLTAVRGTRDLPVFLLGSLALALAAAGRHARRHPGVRPWRYRPGHGPHIVAMTTSYTVMWTAFLVDNAKFLPLTSQLPAAASMLLPAAIAGPHGHGANRPAPAGSAARCQDETGQQTGTLGNFVPAGPGSGRCCRCWTLVSFRSGG